MKGLTLRQLAEAKGFDVDALTALGMTDAMKDGQPFVEIPYRRADGTVAAIKRRVRLDGEGRFWWPKGTPTMPYGLDRLAKLPSDVPIIVVEGESDCWTLWHNEFAAIGIPGAESWKSEYAGLLVDREVYVWQEPGTAGAKFATTVTGDLLDARVIRDADAKDPNDLWVAAREAFPAAFGALMSSARSAREDAAATCVAEADAALALGRELLEDPNILLRVEQYLIASGYAGDTKAPVTVYVALTSRCLRRPLNLAIIAPSAAGKNHAVDAPLPLVPLSAYVVVKASSPRALIFSELDFQHKVVIVSEADSIPDDGSAASAVRALAADNEMAYDISERDPETKRWVSRHIVKPGPTGLITTSTRPLAQQMATRMLTVPIPDTTAQTRAVLYAHANAVNGETRTPNTEAFVAAQQWLELQGDRAIAIPFARILAGAVPAELVRMRRDFRQLLTVIEAITFLRQRQRGRDEKGRVIATLGDYAAARELLLDVFTATATGGVSTAIREVVTVVQMLSSGAPDGVTCATVAATIVPALHRNTAWYRIQAALKLGLLVNAETRKAYPAKLAPGDALPDERTALPTVEQLAALLGPVLPESPSTVESVTAERHGEPSEADHAQVQTGRESSGESLADPSVEAAEAAIQRFNRSLAEAGPSVDDEQQSHVACAWDTGVPMYRAALEVFGTHEEPPLD